MLEIDMCGGGWAAGSAGGFRFITDLTYPPLTRFEQQLVDEYCDYGWEEGECGYGCSDHASWTEYGCPRPNKTKKNTTTTTTTTTNAPLPLPPLTGTQGEKRENAQTQPSGICLFFLALLGTPLLHVLKCTPCCTCVHLSTARTHHTAPPPLTARPPLSSWAPVVWSPTSLQWLACPQIWVPKLVPD